MTSSRNNDAIVSRPACTSLAADKTAGSGMPSRTKTLAVSSSWRLYADDAISIDIEVAEADRFLKHLIGELALEHR